MVRAVIFGCAGRRLTDGERAFFAEADPWGFILFARNLDTPDQIRALTADLRATVGRDAPVLIDQEGGRVQRIRAPHATDWTDPLPFAAGLPPEARAEAMRLRYAVIASELRALGIDVDCAPVLDVARPDTHPIIRGRCYGDDPDTVALLGRAVAQGLMDGGCLPVMKHMPGHGASTADSHLERPVIALDRARLEAVDYAPFRALSDLPMGMTAHLAFDALDPGVPGTRSALVVNEIRTKIGFDGLLMTDDLSMKALDGSLADRAAMALAAGVDVVLHCNGEMDPMVEVAAAVPPLAGWALARAEAALALRPPACGVDRRAALARIAALGAEAAHA
jgi:beta-N-acetylhexosaminidase